MREILFRGKTEDGRWKYGYLFVQAEGTEYEEAIIIGELDHRESIYDIAWCSDIVLPKTIGQYIGLTDKNGKKIFEGDILRFDYVGKNLGVNGIETVVFESGKFGVKWGWHKEFVCLDGFANTTLEVIGNIHDNPELLKGGDKE